MGTCSSSNPSEVVSTVKKDISKDNLDTNQTKVTNDKTFHFNNSNCIDGCSSVKSVKDDDIVLELDFLPNSADLTGKDGTGMLGMYQFYNLYVSCIYQWYVIRNAEKEEINTRGW
jgi:hypothetical protein